MIPVSDFTDAAPADGRLKDLAEIAAGLGFEIVDIAGSIDIIDEQTSSQLSALTILKAGVRQVTDANENVQQTARVIEKSTRSTMEIVESSVNDLREASVRTKTVATWVNSLQNHMGSLEGTVNAVQSNNDEITAIARQVNILAINAKIEAARAGDAGRGFAVVAEAINELSQKTAAAAQGIAENITNLSTWVGGMREEATGISDDAGAVLEGSEETDKALISISESARAAHKGSSKIASGAATVDQAVRALEPEFKKVGAAIEETATGIHEARQRSNALIDKSEKLVQGTVALGGMASDQRYIDYVKGLACKVSDLFEEALANNKISESNLFDTAYKPIPGSDPIQHLTEFTALTDALLPSLQDEALNFDKNVIFCAAVDRNGYLPTHNRKFSHQQGNDPVWNAANCRNRRMFNDRVGLKAGSNSEPFLLQVYRRDMGGGDFQMMKDISAPVLVNNRHWGGLRLGVSC